MSDELEATSVAPRGEPIDEYKECNTNMRHFSNMRFAQTSIFLIMNAFLFNGAFNKNHDAVIDAKLLGVLGVCLSILFIIMQERRFSLWKQTFERAKYLERTLNFKQHSYRPDPPVVFTSRGITNVLYVFFALIWAYTIFA